MEFFLLLLFAGALIYLWRRTEELEVRVGYFEQLVDALNDKIGHEHLAQRTAVEVDPGVAAEEEAVEAFPAPTSESEPEPASQHEEPQSIVPATRAAEPDEQPVPYVVQKTAAGTGEAMTSETIAEPEPARSWRPSFDFEDIFGRLLPIWAGGVTLAVAGFFLVKWSIENGLLGPEVRVALGFLFGAGLLAGAEIAHRQEHRLTDERVRQALAGAGLATLYASFYLAGSLYGLVGSTIAFLGLAGVTGAAILLSFRFGLPSAILGLVGGFAAPMLVGSEEANLPLLALYLALVTGGLTYAGKRQGRSWLALAALAGGLGWGFLILVSGVTGIGDVLAFGGYLVLMGALIPAFTQGRDAAPWLRLGAAGLAAVQMAAMVAQAGFSLLAWGLYGLLAAGLAFFAWRDSRLRPAGAFAAVLAVMMMLFWSDVTQFRFGLVAIGLTAIFAGVPLANIWRAKHVPLDSYQLGGFALAMIGVSYNQFAWEGSQNILALICLGFAMLPALGSFLQWPAEDERTSRETITTLVSAAFGTVLAGLISTPLWAAPLVFGAVTLVLIALGWRREDTRLLGVAWFGAITTVLSLMMTPDFDTEVMRLSGISTEADLLRSVLRWAAVLAPLAALALRRTVARATPVAEVLAMLLGYGVVAQFAPGNALAWIAAGVAVLLAFAAQQRSAARLTAFVLAGAWAVEPLAYWLGHAGLSLVAVPMLVSSEVTWTMIGLQMLPVLIAGSTLLWRRLPIDTRGTPLLETVVAAIGIVTAHLVFKQLLGIATEQQFVALGLIERTLWQALLLGGAVAATRFAAENVWAKPVALGLAGCSLAHFAVYSFILHNPLWAEQAVGAWPLANLLIPVYGIGLAGIWWLLRQTVDRFAAPRWVFDTAAMIVIGVFALSELRHAFAGSILTSVPVGQTEDLLRSLLGIVLAIGFLLWGARSNTRSWRIGSLVLMLGAVLKVFLLDANGLEGLVRVASFVALGFSLIGIGWFYARQLASSPKDGEQLSG